MAATNTTHRKEPVDLAKFGTKVIYSVPHKYLLVDNPIYFAALKIQSSKDFAKGDPAAVPLLSRVNGFASQSGQRPFGSLREQVTLVVEHVINNCI
jgi:hypothetical protein